MEFWDSNSKQWSSDNDDYQPVDNAVNEVAEEATDREYLEADYITALRRASPEPNCDCGAHEEGNVAACTRALSPAPQSETENVVSCERTTEEDTESELSESGSRSPYFESKLRRPEISAPEKQRDKVFNIFRGNFHSSITISDDLSSLYKAEARKFLALQDRKQLKRPSDLLLPISLTPGFPARLLIEVSQPIKPTKSPSTTMRPLDSGTAPSSSHKRSLDESLFDGFLGPDIMNMDAGELQSFIDRLQKRARQLDAGQQLGQVRFKYLILYRILSSTFVNTTKGGKLESSLSSPYFDPPEFVQGQGLNSILRCKIPVENFDLLLEQNKDISFIVYRTYVQPNEQTAEHNGLTRTNPRDKIGSQVTESIQPIAEDLKIAITTFLETQECYSSILEHYHGKQEVRAPYLFVYHQRKELDKIYSSLEDSAREHLTLFYNYVNQSFGEEYAAAETSIARGQITSKHVQYLFKPGDIIVHQTNGEHTGYMTSSWACHSKTTLMSRREAEIAIKGSVIPMYNPKDSSKIMIGDKIPIQEWSIDAWHWEFDGNFQRRTLNLRFIVYEEESAKVRNNLSVKAREQATPSNTRVMSIKDLKVFPITHASEEIIAKLRRRGRAFWKCRNRAYVSYREDERDGTQDLFIRGLTLYEQTDERYMIDLKTYRTLHKDNPFENSRPRDQLAEQLGLEAMSNDNPPDDQFELLLPLKIKGFNMKRKKWYDLAAEGIGDVKWRKETFQKVVMERKAKDLIMALVSNQLASEASTDLIEGKGNGLILLLHGSPGTGKTLTAESVAEIAEKPLYRVTCGDVGTKAEEVEKYLESVLHLGKLWGCVVLLDEADVFLEQRSLEDLERNALVSVFLRVLEYYEGILILTSNRVGTFDEAFKSRIQLALHYPSLGPYQRLRIWENFIDRLESIKDESVDIADLRDHLDDLKDNEMNGRQIRNAITTGRQYAKWKKAVLNYEHLKDVIEISGRFDVYLNKLHGGFTQDQLAEDEGIRLASK